MRFSAFTCAALLATLAGLGIIPSTAACVGYHQTFIDPVYKYRLDGVYDTPATCWESSWTPIECTIVSLAELGEPTSVNDYRQGVYAYTCETAGSVAWSPSASTSTDLGDPTCAPVPYLSVGGNQVPGTGETHCTPQRVEESRRETVESDDVIPSTGIFIVYVEPTTNNAQYRVIDSTHLARLCNGPAGRGFGNLGVDPGYGADIPNGRVDYLACPYY
jgi:hypothetical protein